MRILSLLHRHISLIFSLFITFIFVLFHIETIVNDKNFTSIPQMSCTFVSIVLGFLGVLLSIIFTIKEKTDIIQYFFHSVDWKTFKTRFWISFVFGMINILVSMLLMITDILTAQETKTTFYIWIFSFIYFIASQFEFYSLFFTMIERSSEKKVDPNKPAEILSEDENKKLYALIPKQSEQNNKDKK